MPIPEGRLDELKNVLFSMIPADDSAIGNTSLRQSFVGAVRGQTNNELRN